MEFVKLVRVAARTLTRRPGFSIGAILCLALAIGTGNSLFLFVYGILLRPLPVADPGRLVWISTASAESDGFNSLSYPDLLDLQQKDPAFSGVMGYVGIGLNLRRGDSPEAVRGQAVTANYFSVLGVKPVLGRAFPTGGDPTTFAEPEVVLSYDLWTSRFGADPNIVGKPIFLNEQPYSVVGVAPEKFRGTQFLSGGNALWIPLHSVPRVIPGAPFEARDSRWLETMARLQPGISLPQAQAATTALASQLAAAYPASNQGLRFTLYTTRLGHPTQRSLRVSISLFLLATALLVLLFASTNVTSLLLARTRARMRDLGIRVALGARRGQIIRQLMVENLLLFTAAGVVSLFLAAWTSSSLAGFKPPGLEPVGLDFSIDGMVLGVTFLLAILPGLLFSLIPALQASRVEVAGSLRADSLAVDTPRWRFFNWRNLLLTGQVAISMVLLIAAGLLLRSLQLTQAVDPGFLHTTAIAVPLDLKALGYEGPRAEVELQGILDRLRGLPRVRSAALVLGPPLSGGWDSQGFYIDGHQPPPGRDTFPIPFTVISPGYFTTLGIPLLAGRDFASQDRADGPPVAIVNEEMAERFWPGQSAVGQRVRNDAGEIEIVGVVATSKYRRLEEDPTSFLYLPFAQHPSASAAVVVFADAPPAATARLMRRELLAINPKLPLGRMTTLAEAIRSLLLPARLGTSLLTLCGLLTLVLAAVGIYGTVAYSVVNRSREIGIRMALGAQPRQVLGLILRQNLLVLWIGSVIGLLAAVGFTTLLRRFLYGIGPTDLLTYVQVFLLFCAIMLLAGFFPARRAASVSPAVSLRHIQG